MPFFILPFEKNYKCYSTVRSNSTEISYESDEHCENTSHEGSFGVWWSFGTCTVLWMKDLTVPNPGPRFSVVGKPGKTCTETLENHLVFGRSAARKGQQNHHGLLAFPSLHACFYHMALRILTVYIVILLAFFFQTVCGRVCHALANLRPDPLRSSPNMRVPWRPPRGQSRLPIATKPVMDIIRHH